MHVGREGENVRAKPCRYGERICLHLREDTGIEDVFASPPVSTSMLSRPQLAGTALTSIARQSSRVLAFFWAWGCGWECVLNIACPLRFHITFIIDCRQEDHYRVISTWSEITPQHDPPMLMSHPNEGYGVSLQCELLGAWICIPISYLKLQTHSKFDALQFMLQGNVVRSKEMFQHSLCCTTPCYLYFSLFLEGKAYELSLQGMFQQPLV